jgi:hypothetical protein
MPWQLRIDVARCGRCGQAGGAQRSPGGATQQLAAVRGHVVIVPLPLSRAGVCGHKSFGDGGWQQIQQRALRTERSVDGGQEGR